jgi:hypothetical protein
MKFRRICNSLRIPKLILSKHELLMLTVLLLGNLEFMQSFRISTKNLQENTEDMKGQRYF